MSDSSSHNYVIKGRGIEQSLILNYEQLQQFCRQRQLDINILLAIALNGDSRRAHRGYFISVATEGE